MQAAMQLSPSPVACRLQRNLSTKAVCPTGLTPLGGKAFVARPARRAARSTVAVRAQLEDVVGAALDSAPSAFHNLAAHLSTRLFLLGDVADAVAGAVGGGDSAVAAAVEEVVKKDDGWFSGVSGAFESFLKVLDSSLEKIGVPYSYGFAIILLTLLVKVATYPLTKKQVESTLSMQSMAPKIKELQAKYANDQERLQVETAKMYQTAGVNPLAGCLPSLATIPVFIGLYRALSNVADEGLLTEGFFWIPSLAGPTTVNGGLGWLVPQNGVPPLGWAATAAYLVLPVLLIVSQYISQKAISPPQSQDPSQQQANAILKFLPLMIGYFSLNVPSGLTLYWFTNNLVTTAQQLYLRKTFASGQAVLDGGSSAATAIIDVEVEKKGPSGKDLNARRSPKQADAPAALPSSSGGGGGGGGGNSRGEKFRAIKAREAAKSAAAQAAAGGAAAAAAAGAQERGAKFRALQEKAAAAKAAKQAGSSSSNGNGNGNGSAPASVAEPAATEAGAAVAVVAEVVGMESDSEGEDQQHQAAAGGSSIGSSARGSKGGKKKGSKKK